MLHPGPTARETLAHLKHQHVGNALRACRCGFVFVEAASDAHTPSCCSRCNATSSRLLERAHLIREVISRATDASITVMDDDAVATVGLLLVTGAAKGALGHGVTLLHMIASAGGDGVNEHNVPFEYSKGRAEILVSLLLSANADLEARDNLHGATPLGWSAWYGCPSGAFALLSAKANPHVVDRWGGSPLVWAQRNGHLYVATLMQELPAASPSTCGSAAPFPVDSLRSRLGAWAEEPARIEAALLTITLARWMTRRGVNLPVTAASLIACFCMPWTLWTPVTEPQLPSW